MARPRGLVGGPAHGLPVHRARDRPADLPKPPGGPGLTVCRLPAHRPALNAIKTQFELLIVRHSRFNSLIYYFVNSLLN